MSEPTTVPSKKRVRTHQKPHFKGHEITTRTIKTPPFTYIHLSQISDASSLLLPTQTTQSSQILTAQSLDEITVRTHLTSALSEFLGLSGSAIPIDFLKIDAGKKEVWIRVPREDGAVVVAAMGGWSGDVEGNRVAWKVVGWGNWLAAVDGSTGGGRVWGD